MYRRKLLITILMVISCIAILTLLTTWLLPSSDPLILKHWLQRWKYALFSLRLTLYSAVAAMWYSRVRQAAIKNYGTGRTARTEVLILLLAVLNEYLVWGWQP